jgi:LysM repeat protein
MQSLKTNADRLPILRCRTWFTRVTDYYCFDCTYIDGRWTWRSYPDRPASKLRLVVYCAVYVAAPLCSHIKGRLTLAFAAGDSCSSVETAFSITAQQFLAWNPAVSSDCLSGFWAGYAYCVGTTDTISSTGSSSVPPTTTSSAPTPSVTAPDPHQDNNAISTCNKFAQAQTGDYCYIFAQNNGITTAQLYAWNAVLGSDGSGCGTEFWAGYWYCVGVSS